MLLARQSYLAGGFSGHFRKAPPILGGWFFEKLESLGQRSAIDMAERKISIGADYDGT